MEWRSDALSHQWRPRSPARNRVNDIHPLMYTSGTAHRTTQGDAAHANLAARDFAHIVESASPAATSVAVGPLYHVGALRPHHHLAHRP